MTTTNLGLIKPAAGSTGWSGAMNDNLDVIDAALPVGEVRLFAGSTPPSGWLACDGAVLDPSAFPALFSVIDTTFGGNGTTTFHLPDLRGRTPLGAGTGTGGGSSGNGAPTGGTALAPRSVGDWGGEEEHVLTAAELPEHGHAIVGGPASGTNGAPYYIQGGLGQTTQTAVYAPTANVGQDEAHQNMPPFVSLMFIIRT